MTHFYRFVSMLLVAGMLISAITAQAQAQEESVAIPGMFAMDSGCDSGPAITYTAPWANETSHTATRFGWTMMELPKLEMVWFFPVEDVGNWDEAREFSIAWNGAEYDAGLKSGAERFTIAGKYVPANAQDQKLWDKGLLRVAEDAVPHMEVRVVNTAGLPFRVELGYDAGADGYYPIFSFPAPHGASKVLFEASDDGRVWHSETQAYDGVLGVKDCINSMQWLMSSEDCFFSAHQTSHYRVTVYGSAYDVSEDATGTVSTFVLQGIPLQTKPPDSDLDDSGGNRGGGSQGETDRPGKLEEEQSSLPNPAQSSQPEVVVVPAAPIAAQRSTQTEQMSPALVSQPSGKENTESSHTADEPQGSLQEQPVPEQAQPAFAATSGDSADEEPEPTPDRGHAGGVAGTSAALLIAGAGGVYLWTTWRKP